VSTSRTFFILTSCEKSLGANPTTRETIPELSFPTSEVLGRVRDLGPEPLHFPEALNVSRRRVCGFVGFSSTFRPNVPIGADAITQTLRP
jgi:hypothetical protein